MRILNTCTFFYLVGLLLFPLPATRAEGLELEGDESESELEEELDDEFALLEEEMVVYTAAKHKQDIAESPSAITVITREQIANTHCTDVVCLLRQVPELDVRRYRSLYHTVGARALGVVLSDKGLVLVDGRVINVEAFGMPLWAALPVHLEDIERIEIIRGPGSALYGANAHSMVISITTRKTSSDSAELFLGAGELDTNSLHLRLDKLFGDWRLGLSGGMETSRTWREPNQRDRELFRFRAVLERDWKPSESALHIGLTNFNGILYTALAPGQVDDTYLSYVMLTHRTDWLRSHIWFSMASTDLSLDLPLFYKDIPLGKWPETISMLSTNLDGDAQVDWSFFEGNLLVAGLNYRWLTFMCEANFPKEIHQHRAGFFLQDEQRLWDQLFVTLGVRFDYNNITPFTTSPRVAAVWRFHQDHLVRLAIGQGFRKPAFMNTSLHIVDVKPSAVTPNLDVFFKYNIGNDQLDNESITAFDLGYRGLLLDGALTVEASAFLNLYRDNIYFVTDIQLDQYGYPDLSCNELTGECESSMRFVNQGWEIDTVGGSVSLTYRIQKSLRLNLNYTYRYSWYVEDSPSGHGLIDTSAGAKYTGEPDHLANVSLHYLSPFGLRLGLALHARSDTRGVGTVDGTLFGEFKKQYNPRGLFASGSVSWRFELGSRWFEAGVRAFNLTNNGFRDAPAVRRTDDVLMGGQLLGRRIFLFVRGEI